MGNFAVARVAALTLALFSWTGANAATTLPSTAGYTFYVKGQRVGKSDVRITQTQDALRIESKLRVTSGGSLIELSTRTVADPKTYALRSFSYQGTKAGQAVSSHVTVPRGLENTGFAAASRSGRAPCLYDHIIHRLRSLAGKKAEHKWRFDLPEIPLEA